MTNLVLYRKYRPLSFSDVTGQAHVKNTLANAVSTNRAGHAYLFTGPRGVGKTTIARIFARAVNCPNVKNGEPCNVCDICKDFLSSTSLDILEIDAASHTGVDNIRELIEHLQFAPTRAKYKVIIIDEVHMLSKGAFNALLKTLEEPPAHAIFILATTEINKVPATIVSRTQKFDFKKASVEDLVERLRFVCKDNNVQANDDALLVIAQAADGSFRDALSLLDQVLNFSNGKLEASEIEDILGLTSVATTKNFLELILGHKDKEAVQLISQLMYSGKDLILFHKDFLEFLRKVLIVKVGAKESFGLSQESQKQIADLAAKVSLADLIRIIEIFQKVGGELKWSATQSLPLELAAVEAASVNNPSVQSVDRTPPLTLRGGENEEQNPPLNVRGGVAPATGELFTKVSESWTQILDKLKDYNHSLIPSLKLAKPVGLMGKELFVTFPYKFHKDAVEQRKNRIVVDQVIEEVTGEKLLIKPILEKDWKNGDSPEPEQASNDETDPGLIESALKIMGGEVSE